MTVRTPTNNPFVPGSDQVPEVWAGRSRELADWSTIVRPRRLAGDYVAGRLLLGPPGIGKSVLVNRLAREAHRAGDYVAPAVRVPQGADVLALVAEAVTELIDQRDLGAKLARPVAAVLDRVRRLVTPVGAVHLGPAERSPNPHRDLAKLLGEIAELAADDERIVLLRIDEVQNARDVAQLSQLLVALADALGAERTVTDAAGVTHERLLPLAIYLTGLPDFLTITERAGATFGRRFHRFDLEPLDDADVRHALAAFRSDGYAVLTADGPARVFADDEAIELIVAACLGDPFLFQLAGQAAWHAGTSDRLTADDVRRGWAQAAATARTHVERSLDQLPDRERAVLDACAAMPAQARTATSVAERLGRPSSSAIASALQRLDTTRGILRRGQPLTFRMHTAEALLTRGWPERLEVETRPW